MSTLSRRGRNQSLRGKKRPSRKGPHSKPSSSRSRQLAQRRRKLRTSAEKAERQLKRHPEQANGTAQ